MASKKPVIQICLGSSCYARGNEKNMQVIEKFLQENHLEDEVDLELGCSLCQGRCAEGPNVVIDGVSYGAVDPGMMYELLKSTFNK